MIVKRSEEVWTREEIAERREGKGGGGASSCIRDIRMYRFSRHVMASNIAV